MKRCVPYITLSEGKNGALSVCTSRCISCLKPFEVWPGPSFLPVSLLSLPLCVLFPFPLSDGLYHCCSAITENSRKDTWQMFGEHCLQIYLCVCVCMSVRAGLCVCAFHLIPLRKDLFKIHWRPDVSQ